MRAEPESINLSYGTCTHISADPAVRREAM